jgi:crotonobetainyl-CoA:carnitine CoA-transferase CaiB-like acyl-CoA transferase
MNQQNRLLDGIRIIDLSRILAGPYCTMMLGDLGADVIKIERPGQGDDTRTWGPPYTKSGQSAYFLSTNRNKRGMTLNLKSEKGLTILKELIRQGDVLIENFRAGTMAGWGLDEDTLQQLRPGLIYATITGFGYDGPYRDKVGYDFMIQAMGGVMSVTGPPDREPIRAGIAIADIATGMFASSAILAALFQRERTGEGQRIDMALLDSQLALMTYVASNYMITGEVPDRYGNGHPNIVPYQEFKAADQYFAFAAGNDYQWRKFCTAVNQPDWATDEQFATNRARVENREQVVAMLSALFATQPASHWMALCDGIGVPVAPINNIAQVLDDPQIRARQMQIEVADERNGRVPLLTSPLKIPTAPTDVRLPPPYLGQHTDDILHELLGYDPDQIAALREEGVI